MSQELKDENFRTISVLSEYVESGAQFFFVKTLPNINEMKGCVEFLPFLSFVFIFSI